MALKPRFFQAGFSATLLRSAALVIALILQASPARAEVVTLVCQNESGVGGSFTLRVDYDRKIVDMPNPADLAQPVGTAFFNTATPTITAGAVEWDVVIKPKGAIFRGSLNRLSGQGRVSYSAFYRDGRETFLTLSGPCRRATQKF